MKRTSTYVLLSILGLAFACTNDPFDPEDLVNSPPEVRIFVGGDDLNSTSYNHATFYWSGTDKDGFVEGFYVSIASGPGDDSPWVFTTTDETTASYATDLAGQAFPTLKVVALDNRGALSDTARTTFPLVNFPPVLEFRSDFEPLKESFGAASFDFFGFDLDGDDTLLPHVDYRYGGSDPDVTFEIGDPSADPAVGWVRLEANPTFFSLQLRDIPPGDPDDEWRQSLYVRTIDEAGAQSSFEYVWSVFEVRGDVLLVDDAVTSPSRDAFYRDALDAILPDQYSRWDISEGLPERADDIRLTLEQFDLLVWYTDNAQSPNLLQAQSLLTAYLTTDIDPGTEGDQFGRLLLEAAVVVGNNSQLSPTFRTQILGIDNLPFPRNALAPYNTVTERDLGPLDILSQEPTLPDLVSVGLNYTGGSGRYFGLQGLSPLPGVATLWQFEAYKWGGDRDLECRPDCSPVVAVRRPDTGRASVVLLGFQLEFANAQGNAIDALRVLIEDHLGFTANP